MSRRPSSRGATSIRNAGDDHVPRQLVVPGGPGGRDRKLLLDGTFYDMTLAFGTSTRAHATVSSCPSATVCRRYVFVFTDVNGAQWLYPEAGALVTSGEARARSTTTRHRFRSRRSLWWPCV